MATSDEARGLPGADLNQAQTIDQAEYVAVQSRFRCLELASSSYSGPSALKVAREYYDFVTGKPA